MKKIIILFILIWAELSSVQTEFGNVQDFLYGNSDDFAYDNWVSHIAEGIAEEDYNVYAPWDKQTNGFGNFLLANDELLEKWNDVISEFMNGNYEQAQDYLETYEFPFEVVNMLDSSTGNEFFVLREIPNMGYFDDNGTPSPDDDQFGAFEYGWGLFIYNPHATQPVIITAPHPKDDYISVPIAYDAFLKWDARYLMINGAGREVLWTEEGNYTNSKSLSDPSRNTNHPFHRFYMQACDTIRNDFGRREFSAQIHSADWNKHLNYSDVQISGGNGVHNPTLPIRDLSDLKLDMINLSEPIIHPENTIGTHEDVHLNDYYCVNYSTYDFLYENDNVSFPVDNQLSLPGYLYNRQMLYTHSGWNQYDVFQPFFHIEMHELPGNYETTQENWYWFYGYENDVFDMDNLFTKTMQFYGYWIDRMAEVLPYVFEMNDGLVPSAPVEFTLTQQTFSTVLLTWEPVSSFDFLTYEIQYSNEPFENNNYTSITRNNYQYLASQRHDNKSINYLSPNTVYYFRVRAIDYSGNSSEFSEEIVYQMAPAQITNMRAYGSDEQAVIRWTAMFQEENAGFRIYRKYGANAFEFLEDWLTESSLEGSSESMQQYEYIDSTVENDILYTYKIAAVNEYGYEHVFPTELLAKPETIHALIVSSEIEADTTYFGKNIFATDELDAFYEVVNDDEEQSFISAFYNPNWDLENHYFSRIIVNDFEPETVFHSFSFHLISSAAESFTISSDFSSAEKLYLVDKQTGVYYNLQEEDCQITTEPDELQKFTLYWGNIQPSIMFLTDTNHIYQSGETISCSWRTNHAPLIDYMELYAINSSDTLLLAANIENDAVSQDFSHESTQAYHSLQLVLKLFTIDGTYLEYPSQYYLGIVPEALSYALTEGNFLLSNPFPNTTWESSDFFNEIDMLYSFVDGSFSESNLFEFGKGYWLTANQPTHYTLQFDIQSEIYYFPLHSGWNLVPNPHLCPYDTKSFRFLHQQFGVITFAQAVQLGGLSSAVIAYDEMYQIRDNIMPLESFFLHIYQEDIAGIIFHPYEQSSSLQEPEFNWKIQFTAEQAFQDKDFFVIASHPQATENFDSFYDFPEPPQKPTGISSYVVKEEAFPYSKLLWETGPENDLDSVFNLQWDFVLSITDLEPVQILAEFENVPSTFTVSLYLEDFSQTVYSGEEFVYTPSTTGELFGTIQIQNDAASQTADVVSMQELQNYPNPFNPITTISYSLPKDAKVNLSVYNIKGQKVKTLVHSQKQAGNYKREWDSTDNKGKTVSSGVYFYRLIFDDKEQIKKMILLK